MYIIRYDEEAEDFINRLQKTARSKLFRLTDLISKFGPDLGMPHSRKLDIRLYELRVRGTEEVRFFYFQKQEVIIILHGFKKKTQKIPNREIETAKKRLLDHI